MAGIAYANFPVQHHAYVARPQEYFIMPMLPGDVLYHNFCFEIGNYIYLLNLRLWLNLGVKYGQEILTSNIISYHVTDCIF